MSESTELTVRLPVETAAELAKLAAHTNQMPSVLGAEAIAAYVARELAIVDGIERGRRDVQAGRLVSNDEAFRQLKVVLDATSA